MVPRNTSPDMTEKLGRKESKQTHNNADECVLQCVLFSTNSQGHMGLRAITYCHVIRVCTVCKDKYKSS